MQCIIYFSKYFIYYLIFNITLYNVGFRVIFGKPRLLLIIAEISYIFTRHCFHSGSILALSDLSVKFGRAVNFNGIRRPEVRVTYVANVSFEH